MDFKKLANVMIKSTLLYRNFFLILAMDLFFLASAFYFAYLIRFDFIIPQQFSISLYQLLPLFLITKIVIFYFFDLYRGMWRYTSISDLFNIIKASSLSTLLMVGFILFSTRFHGFSRSVFVIDWCLTILFVSGIRLCIRIYFEHFCDDNPGSIPIWKTLSTFKRKYGDCKRLLIIGAGNCGEKIYREIHDNARLQYRVVGFLDDDSDKLGKKIHGVPVLGQIKDIRKVINKTKADEVLIAISSTIPQKMRNIVAECEQSGVTFKTIPSMGELINGDVTVNGIREVAYSDLLGREVIRLDEEKIGVYLQGQCVLVTGAGGSIGSELCRQICRFRPKCLLLIDRAEGPLYEIELELKQNFRNIKIITLLLDVQDKKQLEKAFEAYGSQTVFHAAAYKHVPLLELQPWEAVTNNIQGTLNIIEAAKKFNVERFVFVSTDKAVKPTSIMGASKRVAEMLIQNQNGCGLSHTQFIIVRFGNVVGSVGSVVPLFKKQIQKGGPVTVTHPEVTRYFMTIPEACQLILQACSMGIGSEIFLLEMGTSIKIDDMARDLIRLSGFEPDVDINIEYIGLRPGEKLYEELIIEGEGVVPTNHEKIMVLKGKDCNLPILNGKIDDLIQISMTQDAKKIKAKLKEIVPEYRPY
ncbi:MAG: hypothetical protein SRB2_00431 [Desulfobacteraceae bacterium Eth-SRB2]|nr:MAG: hypothetical protein SRB2_00431 [Desulfobacteraceae bacterium Eth-SRB2]